MILTGAMKTLLISWVLTGQTGGLVGLGYLVNDFPSGDLQGQSFSSASNTAWQMIWGQGLMIGADRCHQQTTEAMWARLYWKQLSNDLTPHGLLAAMASGFGPLFWALVFRKQVFVWLHTIFESKQRVNDGAFIASLLETEDTTSTDLMQKAQKLLRRIKVGKAVFIEYGSTVVDCCRCALTRCDAVHFSTQWENISRELLATSGGSEATYALSEDCALGEIDFFISHSWSDDATLKYDKLQQVRET